jgi:hypothetical protein
VDFGEVEGTVAAQRTMGWLGQYFLSEADRGDAHEPCLQWGVEWESASHGKPPIILQHHSHSRTVIGYLKMTNGDNFLIVLDPAKQISVHAIDWKVCLFL